jgi:hypothetical protein
MVAQQTAAAHVVGLKIDLMILLHSSLSNAGKPAGWELASGMLLSSRTSSCWLAAVRATVVNECALGGRGGSRAVAQQRRRRACGMKVWTPRVGQL